MKIVKTLSIICVGLVAAGGAFATYAWYQYHEHEADVIEKVKQALNELPSQPKYSSLGKFDTCPKDEGATFEISAMEPFRTYIVMNCHFTEAEARVEIKLQKQSAWVITELNVYPLLN